METKFLSTLKLAHVNSWDWNLDTRELHLINTSDIEKMKMISPLMAMESAVIPNYPDILFEKHLVNPEDEPLIRKYENMILNSPLEEEFSFRLPFKTIDGDTVWLQFFGIVTQSNDNKANRAIGYYTDITKQIEIAKKNYGFDAVQDAYDNIYATVLLGLSADYSNVFWINLDTEDYKPIRLDELSDKLVGSLIDKAHTYKDILGYYINHFVIPEDQEKFAFLLNTDQVKQRIADSDIYTLDYRSERMGEIVYCQMKLAKGSDKHKNTITIGFKNIDTAYRSRMELDYDNLTGLYNRKAFFRYMQQQMAAHPDKSFYLVISDIENFKRINDLYGDKKGDELLHYVGTFLDQLSKFIPNTMFGRYSGDQFVGLSMVDEENALSDVEMAENVATGMHQMYEHSPIGNFEVKLGMYYDIDHSLSPSAICDRALMAVRSIKHQYNEKIAVYDNQMELSYQKELRILENMEEALATKQFKIYYQPKHDCKTGALIGAEALVRWEHPEYGFMSPGEFIPLFEKNGFITNLDVYVFNQVYEDQMRLHESGLPVIPVSVNASRLDLLQPNYADNIIGYLKAHSVDPSWIHIEVTENIFMKNEDILSPILAQFRDYGIKIELDDFGSGYSSLSLLNRLPLDVIKLDMSIIRNLDAHTHVVDASIRLAHVLGFKTTAEGVETPQQVNKLKAMGCDYIQGYYYSKPLPVAGYINYIKNYIDA